MTRSLFVLAAACGLAACSAADHGDGSEVSTTGLVDVQADRLVALRAGNEGLLDKRGEILVGGASNSPYGFLRKAVSASILDDQHIAILTEDASLSDAITSGSVRANHTLATQSLQVKPLDNGVATPSPAGLDVSLGETTLLDWQTTFHDPTHLLPVSDIALSRTVKLTHAEVHFAPVIDLALEVEDHHVESFDAIASGALDASFDLVIDTQSSIDIDRNPQYQEAIENAGLRSPAIAYTLFETEPYVLPTQWIGYVPVIETVRFRVALECDIDLDSASHLETGGTLHSTAAFGARYRDGAWTPAASPTFDGSARFVMTQNGTITGTCDARTEIGLYLYDLAGPTLSVSPYVTFDVAESVSPEGFAWSATPGIRGALGGRLQVFGWQLARADLSLFDVRSSSPLKGAL